MGVDLKKEIKLSDLFRRGPKEPSAGEEPKAEKPERPRKRLFERKTKEPKEPKAPRAPREEAAEKAGPALPAVPLMRAFNLLPGEEAREKRSTLPAAHILVALVGLLVFAGLGGGYILLNAGVAQGTSERDDLRAQLAALEVPPEPTPKKGENALAGESAPRTAALSAALTDRVAWDRILREFALVLPDDVWLTSLSAATSNGTTPDGQPAAGGAASFTISGFADTQASVARLLSRLAVVPELSEVKLQSSTQNDDGTAFAFAIIATVSPQGEPL
ncbi:MAG: PilN domain-containing protein [Gaiellaceae bacterium]